MGLATAIEWTDATWNPWRGCTKVSPACKNCYMFPGMRRHGHNPEVVTRAARNTFRLPLQRSGSVAGPYAIRPGAKVFTCSWSDWFHKDADEWRAEAWEIVRARHDVTFQIVTKRPERIRECLPADWGSSGYSNVWLIATAETEKWAKERIDHLCRIPAPVHGLSMEPLLGDVNLRSIDNGGGETYDALTGTVTTSRGAKFVASDRFPINWIITGGESGPGARPSHPDWFRSIRDQCLAAGVAYFHKQHGDWWESEINDEHDVCFMEPDGRTVNDVPIEQHSERCAMLFRLGKKKTGRQLDGREWSEFPAVAI